MAARQTNPVDPLRARPTQEAHYEAGREGQHITGGSVFQVRKAKGLDLELEVFVPISWILCLMHKPQQCMVKQYLSMTKILHVRY